MLTGCNSIFTVFFSNVFRYLYLQIPGTVLTENNSILRVFITNHSTVLTGYNSIFIAFITNAGRSTHWI